MVMPWKGLFGREIEFIYFFKYNFHAYKAENPSGVNSSLCYEGGGQGQGSLHRIFAKGEAAILFRGYFPWKERQTPR